MTEQIQDISPKIEFSCWELLKEAWGIVWSNAGLAIGGFLIYWIMIVASSSIPLGALILGGPLSLGIAILFLNIVRGRGGNLGDLFKGFSQFGTSFGAYVLKMLIIMAGMILFIIPGIIWALQYFFTMYTIADGEGSSLGALRASKKLTKSNLFSLFLFTLFFGLFNFLGVLFCFIGVAITAPVSFMALAILYNRFAETHNFVPSVATPVAGSPVGTLMPPVEEAPPSEIPMAAPEDELLPQPPPAPAPSDVPSEPILKDGK